MGLQKYKIKANGLQEQSMKANAFARIEYESKWVCKNRV